MIESLIKGDEYRQITAYWITRLLEYADGYQIARNDAVYFAKYIDALKYQIKRGRIVFRTFGAVKFSYGYTKRRMNFQFNGISIGRGKPEWGAPCEDVFIIHLGERRDYDSN